MKLLLKTGEDPDYTEACYHPRSHLQTGNKAISNSQTMSQSQASSFKTRSQVGSSKSSSVSNAAAIARAKAEAAKARAAFTEQEMQLKLQQASLEAERARQQASLEAERAQQQASLEAERAQQQASLELEKARLEATLTKLTIEKETAAAIAEAEVLEAAAYPDSKHSSHSNVLGLEKKPQDSLQRTSEYVYQHSISNPAQETEDIISEPSQTHHNTWPESDLRPQFCKQENAEQCDTAQVIFPAHQRTQPPIQHTGNLFTPKWYDTGAPKVETPKRYGHTPHFHNSNASPTYLGANQATIDFAKFFARRELVTKGLVKFSDRPENYRAWRSSYQNVIRDLDLSCSEELDLLLKWLGNESAEHAKRIRDININYPETGLKMIWDRLYECYGSAEVIENALFKRIDGFPRIAGKGHQKLRELSDLLMEPGCGL